MTYTVVIDSALTAAVSAVMVSTAVGGCGVVGSLAGGQAVVVAAVCGNIAAGYADEVTVVLHESLVEVGVFSWQRNEVATEVGVVVGMLAGGWAGAEVVRAWGPAARAAWAPYADYSRGARRATERTWRAWRAWIGPHGLRGRGHDLDPLALDQVCLVAGRPGRVGGTQAESPAAPDRDQSVARQRTLVGQGCGSSWRECHQRPAARGRAGGPALSLLY